jgi:chorismate mutase
MAVRGVRGAVVAETDTEEDILAATRLMVAALLQANPSLRPGDLASAIFTVSEDLSAAYPARAARELGWDGVPMLCAREIPVPGGLSRCIRVLLHWNTELTQEAVQHIYLGAASALRPDLYDSGEFPDG